MSTMTHFGRVAVASTCLGLLLAGQASAATVDVFLRADVFSTPAGAYGANQTAPITMWGFDVSDGGFTAPAPTTPWSPVVLTATAGDTLNIHVENDLTGPFIEPVSVVIPGQAIPPGGPTWTDGSTGPRTSVGQRVRSFTAETAVGGGPVTYSFANLQPGTYLIESGTHPAVQMQMGLYGALTVYPAVAGQAYDDPSTAFDSEVTLLYSEIDPALHDAVATGNYGPSGTVTSTVEYHPAYFLVNGQPYPAGSPLAGGVVNGRLLIRLLNAGLDTKAPVVERVTPTSTRFPRVPAEYLSVIAEDGNFMSATLPSGLSVPAAKQQYGVMLPAGKTMDAILVPAAPGDIAVYDRRLNLSNAGVSPGGMQTVLTVSAAAAPLSVAAGVATLGN